MTRALRGILVRRAVIAAVAPALLLAVRALDHLQDAARLEQRQDEQQRARDRHRLTLPRARCENTAARASCIASEVQPVDAAQVSPWPALSVIVVHPGPLDDLPNQAGRVGDSRRENLPHMRRNRNLVMSSMVMIAAPFEPVEQAQGGTWRTVEMTRKAKRPLAIVWRNGSVTKERWQFGT